MVESKKLPIRAIKFNNLGDIWHAIQETPPRRIANINISEKTGYLYVDVQHFLRGSEVIQVDSEEPGLRICDTVITFPQRKK